MSCSFALSPVFSPSKSPSRPHYCKPTSLSSSPEMRTLTHSPSPSLLRKPPCGLVKGSNDVVSKRKRPAKLDIPVPNLRFGFDLETPRPPEKESVEEEGDGYAVYCKRGRREAREDRYSAMINIHAHPKQAMFGVYDGHGGTKAAEFAAANLDKNVVHQVEKMGDQDIEAAVKLGYLITDSEFLKEGSHGGSCCVTVLIRKGELVVSNAGDCRAVICRGGDGVALTSDHRPSREDEKNRIVALGGYVDCNRAGVWRINGSLAVSRGIGDEHLKQWVTAEPETKVLAIEPDFEFLILASDGLWDKVLVYYSNEVFI
ncbi:hypothetical protein AgCh_021896 [Apium graveolens]